MVVKQYPYDLWVLHTFDAYQDSEGNWLTNDPPFVWVNTTKCRNQSNTGKTIVLKDGTMFSYSCQILMPLGSLIENNSVIEVRETGGNVRFHGTVRLFVKDQQNMKIWA